MSNWVLCYQPEYCTFTFCAFSALSEVVSSRHCSLLQRCIQFNLLVIAAAYSNLVTSRTILYTDWNTLINSWHLPNVLQFQWQFGEAFIIFTLYSQVSKNMPSIFHSYFLFNLFKCKLFLPIVRLPVLGWLTFLFSMPLCVCNHPFLLTPKMVYTSKCRLIQHCGDCSLHRAEYVTRHNRYCTLVEVRCISGGSGAHSTKKKTENSRKLKLNSYYICDILEWLM